MTETTYREALRQALTDSMRRDPSIVILGEEVGKYGGPMESPKECWKNSEKQGFVIRPFPRK